MTLIRAARAARFSISRTGRPDHSKNKQSGGSSMTTPTITIKPIDNGTDDITAANNASGVIWCGKETGPFYQGGE
jgi:hypothetical protein